jgi:hypothetical protein
MQIQYTPEFIERLWSRIDKQGPIPPHCPNLGPCWTWARGRTGAGYGETWDGRAVLLVHRVVYELTFGQIPDGLFVLHHCDNPPCCNPSHLFAGTHSDNMRDMMAKGRGIRPEQRARGDRNGHRLHPERYSAPPPNPMPGTRHPKSKLTDGQVREIRSLYASGTIRQSALGIRFGVSQVKISQIVRGVVWKHLL